MDKFERVFDNMTRLASFAEDADIVKKVASGELTHEEAAVACKPDLLLARIKEDEAMDKATRRTFETALGLVKTKLMTKHEASEDEKPNYGYILGKGKL